jgi:NAD(P)-dependent dehydrogenase (short-subunit alcohol dehydrogenase family)
MSVETFPFGLYGKTILVTGASSGIGRSIAVECSKLGANLYITGRSHSRLRDTFNLLAEGTHKMIVSDLNFSNNRSAIIENLPMLDGLVNCAGINETMLFQFVQESKMRSIMETNFFSPILLTKELFDAKKISKKASIVFISSISGVKCSWIGNSIYSASKAALNGAIKGIALDLAPKGIRVNSIIPGMIDTEFLSDQLISKEQFEIDRKKYPLKRYGKPVEVAYSTIFLLSDASEWITGTDLLIDGGYTLL